MRNCFVVGIGGGSGSGKSAIAADLVRRLDATGSGRADDSAVAVICQDVFFRDPSSMPQYFSAHHDEWFPNYNHPDATDWMALIAEVDRRSQGGSCAILVVEGILVLHSPALRRRFDLACYVDTPLDQMLARRTRRNLAAGYGGSAETIYWYNTECVAIEHKRFNAPTASLADIIIPNGSGQQAERAAAIDIVVSTIGGAAAGQTG